MDLSLLLVAELLALGVVVGFLAGLLGVGGGMMLVPFLTFILSQRGVDSGTAVKMAIATSMATILFTSVSSLRAHHRLGAVRWRLVRGLAPGIVLGGAVAGICSGFLTGAVGIGGPPLVTWTLMHDWEPSRARGFLWATSLQMTPISMALLVWHFGMPVLWFFVAGLATFPFVALSNKWGMQLGAKWSRRSMRSVTYILLALTSALCVASPWLQPAPKASASFTANPGLER